MKQELSISFRSEFDRNIILARAQALQGHTFGAVSVYDDLGYSSPFPELNIYSNFTFSRLGPACLAIGKYKDFEPVANDIDNLQKRAPGRVFLGIAPGAWMQELGLKPATIAELREAAEALNPSGELPLLIGGWGEKVAALAGEIADEIKIGGSANPLLVPIVKDRLSVGAERIGRNPDEVGIVLGAVTVIDEDRTRALKLARKRAVVYIDVVGQKDPTALHDYPEEMEAIKKSLAQGDTETAVANLPDELARKFMIAGTPEDIIRQTIEMFEAGATRIDFGSPHGVSEVEGINLLGTKVLPYFEGV